MQLSVDRRYPVTVDRLYEILTSQAFFEQRFAWGKVDNYRFDRFDKNSHEAVIRIIQPVAIKTDRMPGFARKLVPASADLTTEFRWSVVHEGGPYIADYSFDLANVPMNVKGSMTLKADGSGVNQATDVTMSCSVPLVGRKLVSLLAPKIEDALDGDYRHTLRYIEEQG